MIHRIIFFLLVLFLITSAKCYAQSYDSVYIYAVNMHTLYRIKIDYDYIKAQVKPIVITGTTTTHAIHNILVDSVKGAFIERVRSNYIFDVRLTFAFYANGKVTRLIGANYQDLLFIDHELYAYQPQKLIALDRFVPGLSNTLCIADATKAVYILPNYRVIHSLKEVSQQFPGQHLFIDLWATWCEPCLKEIPNTDSLQQALAKKHFQLLYISLDNDTSDVAWKKMTAYRNIYGAHIRATKALQDEITTRVWNGIDVYSIPHYLIIDKNGRVVSTNAPAPRERELFNAALRLPE